MAIFKKNKNKKMLARTQGRGKLIHCWWEYKLVQLPCKSVWRFLKKVKIRNSILPIHITSEYTQKNQSQLIIEIPAHPCLSMHYSQ
jgi:hypothetical protein